MAHFSSSEEEEKKIDPWFRNLISLSYLLVFVPAKHRRVGALPALAQVGPAQSPEADKGQLDISHRVHNRNAFRHPGSHVCTAGGDR